MPYFVTDLPGNPNFAGVVDNAVRPGALRRSCIRLNARPSVAGYLSGIALIAWRRARRR